MTNFPGPSSSQQELAHVCGSAGGTISVMSVGGGDVTAEGGKYTFVGSSGGK